MSVLQKMIDDADRRARGHYAQAAADVVYEDGEQGDGAAAAGAGGTAAPPTFEALTKKWDSFADQYSETYQDWSFPGLQQLVSNLWLRERDGNLSILEVGCGPGAGTARILPQIPSAARYVPCDYSAEMVKLARKNLPEDRVPMILQCPASKIPLPDASIDRCKSRTKREPTQIVTNSKLTEASFARARRCAHFRARWAARDS